MLEILHQVGQPLVLRCDCSVFLLNFLDLLDDLGLALDLLGQVSYLLVTFVVDEFKDDVLDPCKVLVTDLGLLNGRLLQIHDVSE